MTDQTIVKPRPGGRSQPQPESADEGTQVAAPRPSAGASDLRLPSTRLDPVCDEASRLLSLADRLGRAGSVADVRALKRQCTGLVTEYQRSLAKEEVSPDTVDTASYCLCALIDELVLHSEWGQASDWAARSLLSEFHSQTWAGTHFFERVDQARREGNRPLIRLQYLCLALGFRGRFRVEERGSEQLEVLRNSLYREMAQDGEGQRQPFETEWEKRVFNGISPVHRIPLWSLGAIAGGLLLVVYLGLTQVLGGYAEPVAERLTAVGVPPAPASGDFQGDGPDTDYLEQVLGTEIERGLVKLESEDSRASLILGNEGLFAPGSAAIREASKPLLSKIAQALEGTGSLVQVTGHTDGTPINSEAYPSNWHLSLARATAVADFLGQRGELEGRLWPEGRGAAEPRFSNDSPESRAGNRRVVITLTPR
ncbi:type IVB secretion system protein IcmH/DotU [Salicola sp. Rm-C-2C1-2]|uniref:type IVB secretion system protein IcmH/DotU n=1 Tax=Salicola sp. Rm-C-2C1-2 TaxID=3141321 RepID=UPI0032E482A2